MATIDELVIKIKSDISNAVAGMKKVEAETRKMTSTQRRILADLKTHWKAYAATIGAVVGTLSLAVKWAAEEEAVSVRTAALLRQQGVAWREVGASLDEYFKKIERLTSYNDTDVQEAFNQLIVTGVDYQTALENLTMVTRVAYSTNLDLRTAAMYVGRAIEGDANMLARYIPSIRKLSEEQRTWANVQKLLNEMMADSSERSKSLQGIMDNLWNQIHNVAEAFGTELIPTIKDFTNSLTEFVEGGNAKKIAAGLNIAYNSFKALVNVMGIVGRSFILVGQTAAGAVRGMAIQISGSFRSLKAIISGDLDAADRIMREAFAESERAMDSARKSAERLYTFYEDFAKAEMDIQKQLRILQTDFSNTTNAVDSQVKAFDNAKNAYQSYLSALRGGVGGSLQEQFEAWTYETSEGHRLRRTPEEMLAYQRAPKIAPLTSPTTPTTELTMPETTPTIATPETPETAAIATKPPVTSPITPPPATTLPPAPSTTPTAKESNLCDCIRNALKNLELKQDINVTIEKIVSEEGYLEVARKVAGATAMGADSTKWRTR